MSGHPDDPGDYQLIRADGIDTAGMKSMNEATRARQGSWGVYFASDDVEALTARVIAAGGQLIFGTAKASTGHVAVYADVHGARFGVIDFTPS